LPITDSIDHHPKARAMNNIAAIPLALVALMECGLASAQEPAVEPKKTQELQRVDPVPPATGTSKPEQAGTQEPSTKGKGPAASAEVFVNGMLAVPGAAKDGQTVPSKYSDRNATIDKLPIAAFTLRHLTDAQKREIYQQLHRAPAGLALSPAYAMVGAEIPAGIALRDLKPVPESLSAKFSELRGTRHLVAGASVLLVGTNDVVIGVVLSAP
jgi:hypothetical protein